MSALFAQLARVRSSVPTIGLCVVVSLLLIGSVQFMHVWKDIPVGHLTRDPTSVISSPPYIGFLSQVGIFFWAASAAVCLFGISALARCQDSLETRRFLILSGVLTLLLGLDDVFLLHERGYPAIGVSEKMVFLVYAGLLLSGLVRFHALILRTEYVLLGMALGCFAVSLGVDLLIPQGRGLHLYEDGAKLTGVVFWFAYHFRTGLHAVEACASRQGAAAGH